MEYIILDMEWNQPISKNLYIREPVNLVGEIIQIGAVKLDSNFCVTDIFKCNISPKFYTKMNKIVEKITNITEEDLKNGILFEDAISDFKKFCGNNFVFLTWGFDDIPMLIRNLQIYNLDFNWVPEFYNLQLIYTNQIPNENRQIALETAVDAVSEPKKEAHDALNDALNTYAVCKHLDLKKGLKIYNKKLLTPPKKKKKKTLNIIKKKKLLNTK